MTSLRLSPLAGPRKNSLAAALVLGLFVVFYTLLMAPSPAHAQRPAPERIAGIVQNGTPGGEAPSGFPVTLLTVVNGEVVNAREREVDERGAFEFTDLPTPDEGQPNYQVTWEYQGVAQSINIAEEVAPANLTLNIYETTDSLDDISMGVHATLVPSADPEERTVGVLELVTVRNDGDRAFRPDTTSPGLTGLDLLRFSLPEGYQDLTVDSSLPQGQRMEIDTGFALTAPVPPGEYQVLYGYVLEYEGSSFRIDRNLPFGAGEIRVMVPPDIGTATGEGLTQDGTATIGDRTYNVFTTSGHARGDSVTFEVSGLPEPSLMQQVRDEVESRQVLVFSVGGALAAAAVGLAAYTVVTRRRAENVQPELSGISDETLSEIAELDEAYEAGEVGYEEYQQRRDELLTGALGGWAEEDLSESEDAERTDAAEDDPPDAESAEDAGDEETASLTTREPGGDLADDSSPRAPHDEDTDEDDVDDPSGQERR